MLKTINNLFQNLNTSNIAYCHWKSTNHLDATVKGLTDLDMLFESSKANEIEKLIHELGFERFDTVYLRAYPGIHDYVCLDESGVWVHLHLHYMLNLGDRWVKAYLFPFEKEILSRVQYVEKYNTFVINSSDELLLHCLRMSLKYRSPFYQKSILEELVFLKDKCTNFTPINTELFEYFKSIPNIITYIFHNEKLNKRKLNSYSKGIVNEFTVFRRFGFWRFTYLSWKRKVYRYNIEFRRRYLKNFEIGRRKLVRGGKIIALVGIDGSGKTSTLDFIKRFFAIQMNVTNVFLGNGKSGASWYRKILFSIYGTKLKNKSDVENINNFKPTKQRNSVFYALWILICLLDKEKNIKKAIAAKANGSLVISDRWPQNQISGTFDGPRLNVENPKGFIKYVVDREQKFLKLVSLVRPDLLIMLDVSPEIAMNRKPGELTFHQAKTNTELLHKIDWPGSPSVIVNSNKPVEEVRKDVQFAIWSNISELSI